MKSEQGKTQREQKASVLKYNREVNAAPVYLGTGKGKIAQRIIKLARENDVQIIANPELLSLLEKLPPATEIPPSLYFLVAEILAFCIKLKGGGKIN
jgi:flagellar biosynthesis protein